MKVLKFGGTSVGTIESLRNVKAIVEGQSTKCIVTVSALGGITDRLIDTARRASVGDTTYSESYKEIVDRHHTVIDGVVTDSYRHAEVTELVDKLLEQLSTLFNAINLLRELTPRTLDMIESYGERMSCIIVSRMLRSAALCDSLEFIRTKDRFAKHVLDQETTSRLIAEKVAPALAQESVVVVPGFISRDSEGRITNLGRGGSDYTAAILAAELGADTLEIWTDVDGFMTADPRVVKNAMVIDRLSFVEAMELCNFGAKVVYPPTIYPVFNRNIPIYIKNTFNPTAPGTLIADGGNDITPHACGVSSMSPTAIIRMIGTGFNDFDRVVNSLTRQGVDIFMASPEFATLGMRGADVDCAIEILSEEFAEEITSGIIEHIESITGLSTIAVVGRKLRELSTIGTKLLSALNSRGIPVPAAPRSNSSTTVACMVPAEFLNEALNAIHSTIFQSCSLI